VTAHTETSRVAPVTAAVIIVGSICLLLAAELADANLKILAPVLAVVVIGAACYRALLPWRAQVGLIVYVIWFIPIKRYTLPINLPFQLEPYRLIVGLVFLVWLTSLMIDPRVRARKTAFDGPVVAYGIAIVLSLLANPHRVARVSTDVIKTLLFTATFFIVYYVIASVIRDRRQLDFIVRALVTGGVGVAISAIVEWRTSYSIFNHLHSIMPFLRFNGAYQTDHTGRLRVFASAQHPIALGAALMLLVPFAIYLLKLTKHKRWWLAILVLLLGSLATSSRTAITMLAAMGLVYLTTRPRDVRRMWPAILPILVAVHFAIPGALGENFKAFFPKGGLIAEQKDAGNGHGRVASFWPAMHNEVSKDPMLGEGFGTRIVAALGAKSSNATAAILDDQWLGALCETGLVGVFSLGWLFVRFLRRTRREAKDDDSPRAWLLLAAGAASTAFAVGMLTYDAFGFIQVTFLLFITFGIGAVALHLSPADWEEAPETVKLASERVLGLRPLAGGAPYAPEA